MNSVIKVGNFKRIFHGILCVGALALMGILPGCNGSDTVVTDTSDLRSRFALQTLGSIPYPPDNPPRRERISLGRLLFFDPILSGEKDVACATCHHPDFGFADNRQLGAGVSGSGLGSNRILGNSSVGSNLPIEDVPRNSPTIWNTAFNAADAGDAPHLGVQFWDGRVKSLEVQATKPITSRVEMRGDAYPGVDAVAAASSLDSVLNRLREIPEYFTRFASAFPTKALTDTTAATLIDSSTYARAIASYERELVTRYSPYDRFVNGDDNALSELQKEGLELFFTKAKCATCHSGPMFSDFKFIVQGVPQEGPGKGTVAGDDLGRQEATGASEDAYAFRTPTLRNVSLTAPYMHDGVFETLEQVVRFYNGASQPRHPSVVDNDLDPILLTQLGLTDAEVLALVEFMNALTGTGAGLPAYLLQVPAIVPSGLTPVVGVTGPGSGVQANSTGNIVTDK